MPSKYSITSNTVKLLKHLGSLRAIQETDKITPIMVCIMPTHRCQLKCDHCCFKNRQDLTLDLDFDVLMEALKQFRRLGIRALELTGGGEPTLYPHIDAFFDYALEHFKVGLITNGISLNRIHRHLHRIAWVRLSLNPIDYNIDLRPAMQLLNGVPTSFCYIWNRRSTANVLKIANFAGRYKIACRVAPDCIQPLELIDAEMKIIEHHIKEFKFLFLSDFNTTLTRRDSGCFVHMIKPALYTDGFIYPCPSAELALENNRQVNEDLRLCRATDVYSFYRSDGFEKRLKIDCSYCKYSKQQDILQDLITETDFNEFV